MKFILVLSLTFLININFANLHPTIKRSELNDKKQTIRFLVSGALWETVEKCGCSGREQGGLQRRIAYWKQAKTEEEKTSFVFDLGDYFGADSKESIKKRKNMFLENVNTFQYNALNVSQVDHEFLSKIKTIKPKKKYISSMLKAKNNQWLYTPYLSFEDSEKQKFSVFGILETANKLKYSEVVELIKKKQLLVKDDYVVVLSSASFTQSSFFMNEFKKKFPTLKVMLFVQETIWNSRQSRLWNEKNKFAKIFSVPTQGSAWTDLKISLKEKSSKNWHYSYLRLPLK